MTEQPGHRTPHHARINTRRMSACETHVLAATAPGTLTTPRPSPRRRSLQRRSSASTSFVLPPPHTGRPVRALHVDPSHATLTPAATRTKPKNRLATQRRANPPRPLTGHAL